MSVINNLIEYIFPYSRSIDSKIFFAFYPLFLQ